MNSKLRQTFTLSWAFAAVALLSLSWSGLSQSFSTFSKVQTISINDDGPGAPYPSSISVPNGQGDIDRVRVRIDSLSHDDPDDIDILLVFEREETDNQTKRRRGVILMSDAGGQIGVSKIDLVFDQNAGSEPQDFGPLVSGTFSPSNFNIGESNDDEGNDAASVNAAFGLTGDDAIDELSGDLDEITTFTTGSGVNGLGTWQLYIFDDREVGSGSIGGWSIELQGQPFIIDVENKNVDEDGTVELAFRAGDSNGPSSSVTVTATSSNTDLIDDLTVTGTGVSRSLSLSPKPDANGTATITLRAVDGPVNDDGDPIGDTLFKEAIFDLTVTPKNDAPTITGGSDATINVGESVGPFDIDVDDGGSLDNETPVANLQVDVTSSNEDVIPVNNVFISGTGKDRSVFIAPEGVATGSSNIKIKVTDDPADGGGGDALSDEISFTVTVNGVDERAFASTSPIVGAVGGTIQVDLPFNGGLIDVDGDSAQAGNVQVVLANMNVVDPGGLTVTLRPPAGAGVTDKDVVLMSGKGGNNPLVNTRLVFDNDIQIDDPNSDDPDVMIDKNLPVGDQIESGTFQPDGDLANLLPSDINGTWSLLIDGLQVGDEITDGFALIVNEGPVFTDIDTLDTNNRATVNEDGSVNVAFIIADNDDNVADLTVTATSIDNPTLLPDDRLTFNSQVGSNRVLTIRPAPDANGDGEVTLTVSDGNGNSVSTTTFDVTVEPQNDTPTISFIDRQITRDGKEIGGIDFTVNDIDVDPAVQTLTVSASSSNDKVIPDDSSHILIRNGGVLGNTGANGSTFELELFPIPNGNKSDIFTLITVTVSDGIASSSRTFELTVRPAESILTVNPSEITILDNDAASPFPSRINVSGVSGAIEKVTATIAGLNHNNPEDLEILLIGPNDEGVVLMSDAGGSTAVGGALSGNQGDNGIQITFDDEIIDTLPTNGPLISGTFAVSNLRPIQTVTGGPAGNFDASLSVFDGDNPNGDWELFIRDNSDDGGDHFGRIAQGWSINIITRPIITGLPNELTISEDEEKALQFSIGDEQGATENFTVTLTSDDQPLIPNGNLGSSAVDGKVQDRILSITSAANANSQNTGGGTAENPNTANIEVEVSDGTNTDTHTITVTVTPVNDDPTIAFVDDSDDGPGKAGVTTLPGMQTGEIAFTVSDVETTNPDDLVVTVASSDTSVVPNENIIKTDDQGTARSISVIPTGVASGRTTITITVSPKDDNAKASIDFALTVDGDAVSAFSNKSGVSIPTSGTASPYPSSINVSGLVGEVHKVKVVVDGFTHGFPEDVDMVLVGPDGTEVMLMSDVGGNDPATDLRFEFDDSAVDVLNANPLSSGAFRPSNIDDNDSLPVIGSGAGDELADFIGKDPNGTWSLFIFDDNPPDSGSIDEWHLILQTGPALSVSDLSTTDFIQDDKGDTDPSNDVLFLGTTTQEDTSIDIGFTIGDSDDSPDALDLTVTAVNLNSQGTESDLVPVTFLKNDDGEFVNANGEVIDDPETEGGVRTDLVISGTGSKRTLTVNLAPNKNTDGDTLKPGDNADPIDPNNDVDPALITISVGDGDRTVQQQFVLEATRQNDAPTIGDILGLNDDNEISVDEDGTINIDFTIDDVEDDGSDLDVALISGNTSILAISGDNAGVEEVDDNDNSLNTRRFTLEPVPNANGSLTVTLTVTDDDPSKSLSGTKDFTLIVNSVNDPPIIGQKNNDGNIVNGFIDNETIGVGQSREITFSLDDIETDPAKLTITATSGDPQLIPNDGIVETGSNGADRTIEITPAGLLTGTTTVTVTVEDEDGGTEMATFTVEVVEGAGQTFNNSSRITFFDNTAASPYPSTINVAGVTGEVRQVSVTLDNITHDNPDDIDILLVHDGRDVVLFSDAGGSADLSPTRITIEDGSPGLPDSSQIEFGTFDPTNFEGDETFPGTAPAPGDDGFGSNLSVFNGLDPNGAWQLFVSDDTDNDLVGEIQNGWSLFILTAPTITNPGSLILDEDVPFTFSIDVDNQAGSPSPTNLDLSGSSSNKGLIPDGNITFGSINLDGSVDVTLRSGSNANSGPDLDDDTTITLTVTDSVTNESQSTSFTVTVNPINDAPLVIGLPRNDVELSEEEKIDIPFSISDVEDNNDDLTVTAISDNSSLIDPDDDVTISGSGSSRTISIDPAGDQTGSATITIRIEDSDSATNSDQDLLDPSAEGSSKFIVVVSPVDDPPTIVLDKDTLSTGSGQPVSVDFVIDDPDTAINDLTVTASSNDTSLVPISGLSVGSINGDGEGTLTITPTPEIDGTAIVTVTVDDGNSTASSDIDLTVRPSTNHVFANDDDDDKVTGDTITINDNNSASPFPSNIEVSGLTGSLKRVTTTLRNINHTFPGDLDILLVGPNGESVILMSDVGSSGSLEDVTLTFDDSAANDLSDNNNIGTGTFQPTDNDAQSGDSDSFPTPAPSNAPSDDKLMDAFGNIDPNGIWSLFVVDDAGGDLGEITDGWQLSIQVGPTISDIADVTIDEDGSTKVSFTVDDLDDAPGDIAVTAVSNNDALVTDDSLEVTGADGDRSLTVSPVADASGTADITVTATDTDGHTATTTFSLTVNPVNDRPVIVGIPDDISVPAGTSSTVSFDISDVESDADGLTLTVTSSNESVVPNDNIIDTNDNGDVTLTITPVVDETGSTIITVEASDGELSDTETFVLSVIPAVELTFMNADGITLNDNSPATPYPSTINVSGRVGEIFKVEVGIQGLNHTFVSDVDMLLVGPAGDSVLLLSDVGGTREATNVDIDFDDDAPDSLPTNSAISSGTFKPTDGDGGQSQQDNVFDPPAPQDPLSFSTSLSVFNGQDPNGTWSLFAVDDTGVDSGSIDSWSLTITTLAPLISGLPESVSTDEDTTAVVNFTVSGGADSVTASAEDDSLVESITVSDDALTIVPVANANGQTTITVSVLDGPKGDPQTNTFDSEFTLIVNPVNDPPTIDPVLDITGPEDTPVVVGFTIDDIDTDPSGLSVSASSFDPDLVPQDNLVVGDDSTLTITPTPNSSGTVGIRLAVSDGEFEDSTSFNVTFEPVNDSPIIIGLPAELSGSEDVPLAFNFTIEDIDTDPADISILAVSFDESIVPNENIAVESDGSQHTVTLTPLPDTNGTVQIRVTARDLSSNVRQTVSVTFDPVNDLPAISTIADMQTQTDASITLSFTVTDNDTAIADLQVQALTLSPDLVSEDGLSLSDPVPDENDPNTHRFDLTVTPSGIVGTATLRVQATDVDGRRFRESFTLTIEESSPTDPPVLTISSVTGGEVTVTWTAGTLQSAPSPSGPWTDVNVISGPGEDPQPAQSPFTTQITGSGLFFRAVINP